MARLCRRQPPLDSGNVQSGGPDAEDNMGNHFAGNACAVLTIWSEICTGFTENNVLAERRGKSYTTS